MYLYGSLTLGDFEETTSDIDFLAVLHRPLSAPELERVTALHARLRRHDPLAWRLEGEYVPREALSSPRAGGAWEGVVQMDLSGQLSADNVLAVRRHGLALHGPPPSRVLPPVSRRLLRETMLAFLQEYRDRYEVSPHRSLQKMTNDALNACRSLYALRRGRIISKTDGALWALQTFDPAFHQAIRSALAARRGEPLPAAEATLRGSMLALTRYAWEQAQNQP